MYSVMFLGASFPALVTVTAIITIVTITAALFTPLFLITIIILVALATMTVAALFVSTIALTTMASFLFFSATLVKLRDIFASFFIFNFITALLLLPKEDVLTIVNLRLRSHLKFLLLRLLHKVFFVSDHRLDLLLFVFEDDAALYMTVDHILLVLYDLADRTALPLCLDHGRNVELLSSEAARLLKDFVDAALPAAHP